MAEKTKSKKRKIFLLSLVAILIIGSILGGIAVFRSPHYALYKIAKDTQISGIDGLKPHLVGEALETVESIEAISENQAFQSILNVFGSTNDYTGVLKGNLSQVSFMLHSLERIDQTATFKLGFDYKGKLVGSVTATMIRVEGDWKISTIQPPHFTTIRVQP